MLKIEHLQAGYGSTPVLFDLNLALDEGQVVTLMGRNGMGKTTTIRTVMGQLRATGGKVGFAGDDITGCAPEQVARRGVGLVPEGRRILPP
ncbi:MAG: ATP-binding cassette domain-containing protein [Micropepsaceae bacterium]